MVLLSSLELFIFVFGSFLELYSCSCSCNKPFGCLKIHKRDDKTLLSCITSSLDSSVEFVDPSGKYYRYYPASFFGDKMNCSKHVEQDKMFNVTTLTLKHPFDTSNFGKWKCVHGSNHIYDTSSVDSNSFLRFKSDSVFGSFLELYSCLCSCNKPLGCLQIYKRNEKTLLSCRTSSLDSSVEFVDPSGKNYRYYPASFYGDRMNCSKHVKQDKMFNVTILTLYNPFDTSNFGKWKCVHGPNHICNTSTVEPNNCLRFKSDSDITSISSDFVGQALKIGNGFIFQFTCKLHQIPIDKSLMFLVNDRTVDILRFEKMDCYNIKGKCIQSSCSCSLSNKTFQWFYSIYAVMENWIFEVQARYTNTSTGKIVQLSWSRTFQTLEFGTLTFRTEIIRPDTKETEWQGYTRATINMLYMGFQKGSKIIYSTFELLIWVILGVFMVFCFAIYVIIVINCARGIIHQLINQPINQDEILNPDEITGQTPYKHPHRDFRGKKTIVTDLDKVCDCQTPYKHPHRDFRGKKTIGQYQPVENYDQSEDSDEEVLSAWLHEADAK